MEKIAGYYAALLKYGFEYAGSIPNVTAIAGINRERSTAGFSTSRWPAFVLLHGDSLTIKTVGRPE